MTPPDGTRRTLGLLADGRVEQAGRLAAQAALILASSGKGPQQAVWRLLDAAVLLVPLCPPGTVGLDQATGRGARLHHGDMLVELLELGSQLAAAHERESGLLRQLSEERSQIVTLVAQLQELEGVARVALDLPAVRMEVASCR